MTRLSFTSFWFHAFGFSALRRRRFRARSRRAVLGGLLLLAAISAPGASASAAGPAGRPVGGESLAAWAAGLELRLRLTDRYVNGTYYIWRLAPAGRATGVGHSMIDAMSLRGGYLLEEDDIGAWRVADGLLCLTWPKFFAGREHCYRVEILGPRRARFTSVGRGPSFVADWAKR